MIPSEVISEILSRADIVQVISNYISVIKKGNSYVALCPFHDDKNPSMMISQSKQIYKCFSCGAGGNVFTFVSNYEKIPFIDAVRKVAEIINYTSPLLEKKERKVSNTLKNSLLALKDAAKFYNYILKTPSGNDGKKYLENRNISDEMIEYFSLGFSPSNGEATIKQLRAKGHTVETLESVGILINERGNFSDFYKGRIIFPIHNEYGEVIGFSARRVLNNDDRKFVNSPSSEIFNKSAVLYNYQNVITEAKKANYCYIVEGFMDVFALYKIGIKSCVAIMGTAFTKYHAQMLKKLGVELRLCLDGDDAGQHGILSMIEILDSFQINYRIVDYKNDLRDPDEIYTTDGSDSLLSLVKRLIRKNDFLLNYFRRRIDLKSVDGKKEFIKTIVKYLKNISDVEKDLIANEMAALTSVSASIIKKEFDLNSNIKSEPDISLPVQKRDKKVDKIKRIQRQLLYYMMNYQDAYDYIKKYPNVVFVEDTYLLLASYIEELRCSNIDFSISELINAIQTSGSNQQLVNEITDITTDRNYPNYDEEIIEECLLAMSNSIAKRNEKERIIDDAYKMDELERAKKLDERSKGVK